MGYCVPSEDWLQDVESWVWILVLPSHSSVTLAKSLPISGLPSWHL